MGSTYTATLEKLSPEGVQLVRVGQRGWLKMARQSCPLETWGSSKDMRGARVACFEQLYRERIEEIKASAVKVGPFLFSRVDKVQAVMVDHPDPDDAARLATQQEAYPRIDQPQTEQTAALNKMLLPRSGGTECGVHSGGSSDGTGLVDYKMTFANEKVVSVTWSVWSYCFGAAHGQGFTSVQNIVLGPQPRPLKPEDLFSRESDWKKRLVQLGIPAVRAALKKRDQLDGDKDLPPDAVEAVESTVTDPTKWSLHKDGLEVQFDPYGLDMGYPVVADILIPWSDLKPTLAMPPLIR